MTAGTIPQLFGELAQLRADHVAVITPEGSATYRELEAESTARAAQLITAGVRKGTLVALLAPNGTPWIQWWMACARLGAVIVPMNTFATTDEVRKVLAHSGAHVFIAVPEFAGKRYRDDLAYIVGLGSPHTDRCSADLPQLRRVMWMDDVDEIVPVVGGAAVVEALAADVDPADALTIIYSSGSTGDPKGVVHSQGATVRQARRLAEVSGCDEATVLWTSMPLNWVGGLVWSMLRTFVVGGTFVTQSWFEPADALEMFDTAGVDTITAWGPVIERLRTHRNYQQETHGRIKGLGWWLPNAPDRPSALGMTETLGPHSGWSGGPDVPVPDMARGSWGRALDSMQHRVVDAVTRDEVADGRTGELLVRGDSLMIGLHRRERADVFTPDGWYATGDAAQLRDGWLFFQGRLDDIIKTAGANVSPGEVVAVLQSLPRVKQAFVVGVPHSVRGEDVAAAIVPVDDGDVLLDTAAILEEARARLASYKVPRRVLVVDEDRIPWLSSQKVDVRRLRAMFIDQETTDV